MLRYVMLVWNELDTDERELAFSLAQQLRTSLSRSGDTRWIAAVENEGLLVLHTESSIEFGVCQILPDGGGAVLGNVFPRTEFSGHGAPAAAQFDSRDVRRLADTRGKYLVDSFWGHYVAVLRDPQSGVTRVLRAPVSLLPCFEVRRGGVGIYFSHVHDVAGLRGLTFTFNWQQISARLIFRLHSEATSINEISEVLPGQCIEVDKRGRTRRLTYWSPLEFIAKPIQSVESAREELRATIRSCVQAWASTHTNIVLSLSGGLDSSILLSCLADAPSRPKLTCVTAFSSGCAEDERSFAREAAQRHQATLIEVERRSDVDYRDAYSARLTPTPAGYTGRVESARADAAVCRSLGATGMFFGDGGDEILFSNYERHCVYDHAYYNGISPALIVWALRAAVADGLTVWQVLKDALKYRWQRPEISPSQLFTRFARLVHPDVLRSLRDAGTLDPVWCRTTENGPPGKLWQLFTISVRRDNEDYLANAGDPRRVSPLLSQPIIESALRIPTYILRIGGVERGLARQAFAADLPASIVQRRTKGTVEQLQAEIVRRNIPFMREMLLSGNLMLQGLINGDRVRRELSDLPSGESLATTELVRLLNMEIWLRLWQERMSVRAAA